MIAAGTTALVTVDTVSLVAAQCLHTVAQVVHAAAQVAHSVA